MPLSKEHKTRTRERIVQSAGEMFRKHGYSGIGIDNLMAGAELTRGGFYAHFASKESLFEEVVSQDHGLLRQLRRRAMKTPQSGCRETLALIRDYLHPAHLAVVAKGCSFAALTGDVARSSEGVKAAYALAFEELAAQLLRTGQEEASQAWRTRSRREREVALAAVQCMLGSVILASALYPHAMAAPILKQASEQTQALIRALFEIA